MKLSPIVPGAYPLFDLIRPAGSEPIPLDFTAAEALDARARAAYRAGEYGLAAGLFEELAALLVTAPLAAHATMLATDRDHARRNAAAAASMADGVGHGHGSVS